ncbi:hypothetical protein GRJ22_12320 [Photobacterium carnosum]|uniref:hypothetical protein n=1 Tax=Photobacterium carnosum TaxID=2023717 RepID=UPI001E31C912|nr:hypothetical protein [Photobacterium carnosum]MCD9557217.1 hypothetical protein [Photobacterium carnosum]
MEFLLFFIPDVKQPIQLTFFLIISTIFTVTLIALIKNANPKNWEKNWQGQQDTNEPLLGSEQGSLQDICSAVATKSEKVCDVMPGFLLIIGLLGTFLGLGIALNHASDIISGDASGQNYDKMMSSLMEMMGGLGTKFKTSIWGISGFILIRTLSSFIGADNKRLFWCAKKLKEDSHLINKKRENTEEHRIEQSFQLFSLLGDKLSISIEAGFKRNDDTLQNCLSSLVMIKDHSIDSLQELSDSNQKMQYNLDHLKKIQGSNEEINSSIIQVEKRFVEALTTLENIEQNNILINNKLDSNSYENNQLLEEVSRNISSNNNLEQLTTIHMNLDKVVNSTIQNAQQMKAFSESSRESLLSLSSSSQLMHEASQGINEGASKLSITVDAFDSNMSQVMTKVSSNLDSTISNMSSTFTNSMSGMAKDMEHATTAIAKAVKDNAESVEVTMNTVKGSIDKSLSIQNKSSLEFTLSSQTLNESIESITTLVNDLNESITSGLRAVSTSGKQVQSLNKRYSNISDIVGTLIESLNKVNGNTSDKLDKLIISLKNYNVENKDLIVLKDKSVTDKFNKLTVILNDKNTQNKIHNDLQHILNEFNTYHILMKSNAEKQHNHLSTVFNSNKGLENLSGNIQLNHKELKKLNSALNSISNTVELISTAIQKTEVIAA